MAEARRRIEHIIETDPVIRKGLQRRIVNSRALARYMMDVEGVDSTYDAILGIIRRYPVSSSGSLDVYRVFRECELSLRDKLAELEVEYHQETMYQIAEFASNLKTARGESLKLVVGLGFIRIIADQNALENLRRTLRPRAEINYSPNLTEISVHLPPAALTMKEIAAKITMELALNDINLAGMIEGPRVVTLLVTETDAPRALQALQRMLKEEAAIPKQTTSASEINSAGQEPLGERGGRRNPVVEPSYSPRDKSGPEVLQDSYANHHRKL